ncbi:uncharacterized protein LOC131941083 [Physella acuta]|uniref:uncharacterized protein LOC131941083 n=1 Tax=Physella acuta TaxID=109671 RepID=UPI0027DB3783|nr:uncharacterized protein LOC131941083 [Physella acuta]
MCHFVCDWGFKANGLTYTHCKDDGHWSDPGRCSIMHCGELPTIHNGEWRTNCEKNYGTNCAFLCNDGYIVHGATTVQCMFNGVRTYWSAHGGCVGVPEKSVAPPVVKDGAPFSAFCDADIAWVPENIKGIISIQMSLKSPSGSSVTYGYLQDFPYSSEIGDSPDWGVTFYGVGPKNKYGLLHRNKFRMRIDVPHASTADRGVFCCEIAYSDSQSSYEASSRCQDIRVGNKAIIHPSVAIPGEYVTVSCDADLAGVPITASGLEYLMLTWNKHETEPSSMLMYDISGDPGNTTALTHITKPSWTQKRNYFMNGPRPVTDRVTFNMKFVATIGLSINQFQVTYSGWYCCGAAYVDNRDESRYTYGCQYLPESRRIVQLYGEKTYPLEQAVSIFKRAINMMYSFLIFLMKWIVVY